MQAEGKAKNLFDLLVGLRVEKTAKLANAQCPPLPRRARIGEVPQAEEFGNC